MIAPAQTRNVQTRNETSGTQHLLRMHPPRTLTHNLAGLPGLRDRARDLLGLRGPRWLVATVGLQLASAASEPPRAAGRLAPSGLSLVPSTPVLHDWMPTVTRWCRRLGGPGVDAEDAAQDVMIVLVRRLSTVRDPAALPTWVFAVTRKVLASHRRRAWIRRWVGLDVPDTVDPAPGPDRGLDDETRARLVELALHRLSASHREIIVLVDVEERSVAEAAALLGVAEGTVKSRLSRARDHLRSAARHVGLGEDP